MRNMIRTPLRVNGERRMSTIRNSTETPSLSPNALASAHSFSNSASVTALLTPLGMRAYGGHT
jgi:hypothetical protein